MAIVFQYGSNMLTSRINSPDRLNGKAKFIEVAYTENDYEFDFTVWSKTNSCAAADIIPNGGRKIWGVLYEIPDYLVNRKTSGKEKSLDAIEGEGTNYKRTSIRVRHIGGRIFEAEVITYVAIDRKSDIQTSQKYVEYILDGLKEHNIPNEYRTYIKERILANNPNIKDFVDK